MGNTIYIGVHDNNILIVTVLDTLHLTLDDDITCTVRVPTAYHTLVFLATHMYNKCPA